MTKTGVSSFVGWFRKEIIKENKEKDDRKTNYRYTQSR